MKHNDPIPDRHKFGYEHNLEMDTIRKELLAEGMDPAGFQLESAAIKRYQENHKDDLTYRQRQDLARYNGEKWVTPHPSPVKPVLKFTDEEIEYLKEMLDRVNDPIGLDILDKLNAA